MINDLQLEVHLKAKLLCIGLMPFLKFKKQKKS
jgi:hypothetical protein